MKNFKLFFTIISFAAITASAFATVDLIPTALTFKKGLDDDVSMTYSQHVMIKVKNIGNTPYVSSDNNPQTIDMGFKAWVLVGNYRREALIYGPASTGGLLGGKIDPGMEGMIVFRIPVDSLKHCQKYTVAIDLTHSGVQSGPAGIYLNDITTLTGRDLASRMICFDRIIDPAIIH